MAINLQKGERANIELPKFTIGLGWDINESHTGGECDLDASVFLLGENRKILSDPYFVFYNNLESPDGAVKHSGDNRTGAGDGDDETIHVDLSVINPAVKEICVVVTIHEAAQRKQNFGQIRNSFIRIYDAAKNVELVKYELGEDFSIETAVEFGRIYKRENQWRFEAVGLGQKGGLEDFLAKYA
ncbi:TerD family protein [Chitinophaga filiformis]|uniref:TerD family protein n=2 Tax=Chitinophaga filiformis TaxID=104663 RepID=A0ABY4I4K9_CHIFI|nr:TerD family protein [Chitinophaga filiformis]UPK70825.1 TerD family protein [Chitinophaga filiformis]